MREVVVVEEGDCELVWEEVSDESEDDDSGSGVPGERGQKDMNVGESVAGGRVLDECGDNGGCVDVMYGSMSNGCCAMGDKEEDSAVGSVAMLGNDADTDEDVDEKETDADEDVDVDVDEDENEGGCVGEEISAHAECTRT